MMDLAEFGLGDGPAYLAGELVDPGHYRRLNHSTSIVIEGQPDYLPASCDGTVAVYTKVELAATFLKTRPQARTSMRASHS
jgi:hypothetical protein